MVQQLRPKLSKATPHKIHQFSVSLKYSTIKKTTFLKTSINYAPESLKKKICEKIQKFTFFHIYSPLRNKHVMMMREDHVLMKIGDCVEIHFYVEQKKAWSCFKAARQLVLVKLY